MILALLQQKRVSQQIHGIFGSRFSNNIFCFMQRTNYRNKTTLYVVHALREAKTALLKKCVVHALQEQQLQINIFLDETSIYVLLLKF